MPRTKRPLAEVDGNISSAPKSKRTFNSQAASKQNGAPAEKAVQDSGSVERLLGEGNATNHDHGEADIPDDRADTVST